MCSDSRAVPTSRCGGATIGPWLYLAGELALRANKLAACIALSNGAVSLVNVDPFDLERGKLATYKVDGDQILKTVDGTNWRVFFRYGDAQRLRQVAALLNESALGNCGWLRKELRGEPTVVSSCDDCPLFEKVEPKCQHPNVAGRAIAYVATQRPDWCPLDDRPLYLKTRPN